MIDDTETQARLRGYRDAKAGKRVKENPFRVHESGHWHWLDGWADYRLGKPEPRTACTR